MAIKKALLLSFILLLIAAFPLLVTAAIGIYSILTGTPGTLGDMIIADSWLTILFSAPFVIISLFLLVCLWVYVFIRSIPKRKKIS